MFSSISRVIIFLNFTYLASVSMFLTQVRMSESNETLFFSSVMPQTASLKTVNMQQSQKKEKKL